MTYLDGIIELFPFRADIRRKGPRELHVAGYLGQVDPRTGAPPRFPPGTLIVPERDEDGHNPVAELILGHRQVPITWALAFTVP